MINMNIQEAEHFESLLKTRSIVYASCDLFGRAAIEDCLVYDAKDRYKGKITVTLMKNGERGFFFIETGETIIRIIDITAITEIKTSFFDNDVSEICIGFRRGDSYSNNFIFLHVKKEHSFFKFSYKGDK